MMAGAKTFLLARHDVDFSKDDSDLESDISSSAWIRPDLTLRSFGFNKSDGGIVESAEKDIANQEDRISILKPVSERTSDTQATESTLEDEIGDEMGNHALIWRLYADESLKVDSANLDGWNRSIDVLLIFAGLFSAVLTTFIIQAYTFLVPDETDLTNSLLLQILEQQRNISLGMPLMIGANQAQYSPSLQARWINGLWFTSLVLSLTSALIAMLAKQWLQSLYSYYTIYTGSPRERVRLRQFQQIGIKKWYIPEIISALPLFLHASLLLFFAGVIILLWSLDTGITTVTLIIVVTVYIFYAVSTALPLFIPECPYVTPVTIQFAAWFGLRLHSLRPWSSTLLSFLGYFRQERASESANIEDTLDAEALCWLFTAPVNASVVSSAAEALAGLPRNFTATDILRNAGAIELVEDKFLQCFHPPDKTAGISYAPIDTASAERLCRAWLNLSLGCNRIWPINIVEPLWALQKEKSGSAAIASCVIALSAPDCHLPLWELLWYLEKAAVGELEIPICTQCWILEVICECLLKGEMPATVLEKTKRMAVPIFLRLTHVYCQGITFSGIRSVTVRALYLVVHGNEDIHGIQNLSFTKQDHFMGLWAFSSIILYPQQFHVNDWDLNVAVEYLGKLTSQALVQSLYITSDLLTLVQTSLIQSIISGKLHPNGSMDNFMADVLQMLCPWVPIPPSDEDQTKFVEALVGFLTMSRDLRVQTWSVSILARLLKHISFSGCKTFGRVNGIATTLSLCHWDDPGGHHLLVASMHMLFRLVHRCLLSIKTEKETADAVRLLDLLVQSPFFDVLSQSIKSKQYRIPLEHVHHLEQVCLMRPHTEKWRTIIYALEDFIEASGDETISSAEIHDLCEKMRFHINVC